MYVAQAGALPVGIDDVYHGPDGYCRAMEEWNAAWRSWRAEIEDVVEVAPNKVLITASHIGEGLASGARIEQWGAALYTFRRGKILRVDGYLFSNRESVSELVRSIVEGEQDDSRRLLTPAGYCAGDVAGERRSRASAAFEAWNARSTWMPFVSCSILTSSYGCPGLARAGTVRRTGGGHARVGAIAPSLGRRSTCGTDRDFLDVADRVVVRHSRVAAAGGGVTTRAMELTSVYTMREWQGLRLREDFSDHAEALEAVGLSGVGDVAGERRNRPGRCTRSPTPATSSRPTSKSSRLTLSSMLSGAFPDLDPMYRGHEGIERLNAALNAPWVDPLARGREVHRRRLPSCWCLLSFAHEDETGWR